MGPFMIKENQPTLEEIKDRVLIENTAQSVLKHLMVLDAAKERMLTRWVWELLQNSRDTMSGRTGQLIASIEWKQGELIFQHNGPNFKIEEITHLIYHGSTKTEDEDTIGRYGSGFLTTHLLSPTIGVSGQLEDGRSFNFDLKREVNSVGELSSLMDTAWDDFKSSLSEKSSLDGFTTRFRYRTESDSDDVIEDGLDTLKKCAPYIVVFNDEFSRIDIKSPNGTSSFEVIQRKYPKSEGIKEVTVKETENGDARKHTYILAEGSMASVAVPVGSERGKPVCLPIDNIPRLFLGFPLVGTEDFSFPAVINSFGFAPTEERDGVYLWQSNSRENLQNQEILEQSSDLLITLIRFMSSQSALGIYRLVTIPDIRDKNWLNENRFRDFLKNSLTIRHTLAVITESGNALTARTAALPFADTDEGVATVWHLLNDLKKYRTMLPRKYEALGWRNAVHSWANVADAEPTSFSEVKGGLQLAREISGARRDIDQLQRYTLRENVCPVDWLKRLNGFLVENGMLDIIKNNRVVPCQRGDFHKLNDLYRDENIPDELKDIASGLGWDIRHSLRDPRITSLKDEPGAGNRDSEYVKDELIKRLRGRVNLYQGDKVRKSNVELFAWLVSNGELDSLNSFPVFSEEVADARNRRRRYIITLSSNPDRNNIPLAPVSAWPKDLQPYAELFPRRYTLANEFFDKIPDVSVWRTLDDKGFLERDVIYLTDKKNIEFNELLPDEGLSEEEMQHKSSEEISLTNIAFLTASDGIMDRARQSRVRSLMFWDFLTKYLALRDPAGLEIFAADCDCGSAHNYYHTILV